MGEGDISAVRAPSGCILDVESVGGCAAVDESSPASVAECPLGVMRLVQALSVVLGLLVHH